MSNLNNAENISHVGKQSTSDERHEYMKANRKEWLANLPAEFHEYGSYAVYDRTKTPYLVEPLLTSNTGKLYPTGGKDYDRLAALSGVQLALEKYPELVVGPALQLLGSYRVACIDLDDPEKTYAREVAKAPQDAAKLAVARDRQTAVNETVLDAFRKAGALIMRSQSGTGYHIFFRYAAPGAELSPLNGRFSFCGDLILHRKFVFITGEQIAVEWPNEVGDDADTDDAGAPVVRMFTATDRLPNLSDMSSALLLGLKEKGDFSFFKSISGYDENGAKVEVLPSTDYGRKVDLTDALPALAAKKHLAASHLFLTTGVLPAGITSVSWALRNAVAALDEVTGSPLQIEQTVMTSPALKLHPRDKGESREDKTLRLLPKWIEEGRARNDRFFAERQAKALALGPTAAALKSAAESGQLVVGAASHVGAAAGDDGDDADDIEPPREAISNESVKRDIANFTADAKARTAAGERVHSDELSPIIDKIALLRVDRQLTVAQQGVLGRLLLDSGVYGFSPAGAGPGRGSKEITGMIAEAEARIMNERKSAKWQAQLMRNEYGGALTNEENAAIAVENMFGEKILYDKFKDKILLGGARAIVAEGFGVIVPAIPGIEMGDVEHFDLLTSVQRTAIGMIDEKRVRKAVMRVARKRQFDSLEDYLRGLKWDGIPRLDIWMHAFLGAVDTRYNRQIGRWWPIGAVARALQPGIKMDNMPVFASGQGKGKNKALIILSGGRSLEFADDFATKDGQQKMRGYWFIEMAELSALNKRDHKAYKAFQTRLEDEYRKAFDVDFKKYPRQFVTVGTTNHEPFLSDPTGERRYWIVDLGKGTDGIRHDALARNVDQIWAEAVWAFDQGEKWWPEGAADRWFLEAQVRVNEKWTKSEPWDQILRDWLVSQGEAGRPISKVRGAAWILETVLERERGQMTQNDMNRVTGIMQKLGYDNRSVWLDGKKVQGYMWEVESVLGEWWVSEVDE